MIKGLTMYLIDTNVISEIRKGDKANPGVKQFYKKAVEGNHRLYISAITIGELRRGVDMILHRGDMRQAEQLEKWLSLIILEYEENILDFTAAEALIWGNLRVPNYENSINKQIAATALTYELTLVTGNIDDFEATGVALLNPFE